MSHTVHGLLRKEPFIKNLDGDKGTMFAIELSEMVKDYKTDEKTYSNYKAILFAKTQGAYDFYLDATKEGSFVVISCEKLKVETREHEGKTYVSLIMDNARLEGAHFDKPQSSQTGFKQSQQPSQQQAQDNFQYPQGNFAPQGQGGYQQK